MTKQTKKKVHRTRRPLFSVDGFSEYFCRMLYAKLKNAFENHQIFDGTEICPGWTATVNHLGRQLNIEQRDLPSLEGIEKLIMEAQAFLKLLD